MTRRSRKRDSSVMMSSVRPSTKNSCSGSPLMLTKGSTTSDGFSVGSALAPPRRPSGDVRSRVEQDAEHADRPDDVLDASARRGPRTRRRGGRRPGRARRPRRRSRSGSASACSRAATLTPSPKMSPSSTITSPRLMPIRNWIQRAGDTSALRRAIRRWISAAHSTASATLWNSTSMPSPVVLMMLPLVLGDDGIDELEPVGPEAARACPSRRLPSAGCSRPCRPRDCRQPRRRQVSPLAVWVKGVRY